MRNKQCVTVDERAVAEKAAAQARSLWRRFENSCTTLIPGPTYQEMLDPRALPAAFRDRRSQLAPTSWTRSTSSTSPGAARTAAIRHVVLPKELTGVKANIVVLVGRYFPSGSHKVGPAYATLMEGELAGEIEPGESTIIGPSTGNFGIGMAYISRLKGYSAVVIMPEQMSAERYQRIRQYGGQLDLTPGLGERRHPGAGAHRAL